ncbi:Serine/threonine-protein kinase PrkC [Varanus komodoensis]|nr:Serine/threonine-protein kinase PrkC [Varanus komodoensis]
MQHIIDSALKPSTRKSYMAKWKCFSTFAESHSFSPLVSSIEQILQFLLELHHSGLKPSSIKVYTAAIAYYRGLVDRSPLFSHPILKRFLKGLYNLNPSIRPVMPTWGLSVVLQALMKAPFEPLATVDLRLVSWKTAFLVAVMSARRASELCARRVDPPYLNFHREKDKTLYCLPFFHRRRIPWKDPCTPSTFGVVYPFIDCERSLFGDPINCSSNIRLEIRTTQSLHKGFLNG